jgi:hypothetical protein
MDTITLTLSIQYIYCLPYILSYGYHNTNTIHTIYIVKSYTLLYGDHDNV